MSYRKMLENTTMGLGNFTKAVGELRDEIENEVEELYEGNDPDDPKKSKLILGRVTRLHQLSDRLLDLHYMAEGLAVLTNATSEGVGQGFSKAAVNRAIRDLVEE